jgi:hypothetical protein
MPGQGRQRTAGEPGHPIKSEMSTAGRRRLAADLTQRLRGGDACRDNDAIKQLASQKRGLRRGLAAEKADGILIAFATQANQSAADGDERNSPFTTALLPDRAVDHLRGIRGVEREERIGDSIVKRWIRRAAALSRLLHWSKVRSQSGRRSSARPTSRWNDAQ